VFSQKNSITFIFPLIDDIYEKRLSKNIDDAKIITTITITADEARHFCKSHANFAKEFLCMAFGLLLNRYNEIRFIDLRFKLNSKLDQTD